MNDKVGAVVSSCISMAGGAVSIAQITEWLSLISAIIGILSGVISLVFVLRAKIKDAEKDGSISAEELEDIKNTAIEGTKGIIDSIEEAKKEKADKLKDKKEGE